MNPKIALLIVTTFLVPPNLASSANISGCVTAQNTSLPITHADFNLFGENGNYLQFLGQVNSSGCYLFTGLSEGNYQLEVAPHTPSEDQEFINVKRSVVISPTGNVFNFALSPGGNISGTVTTEVALANPNIAPLKVDIFDTNWNYVTWGSVDLNSGGNYMSHAVAPGDYYVKFSDSSNQFQEEWYDSFPSAWQAVPVRVATINTITENINASLHEITEAANRYYFSYGDVSTFHKHSVVENKTLSYAVVYAEIERFSDSAVVSSDNIAGFSITTPSGECIESKLYTDTIWRLMYKDLDNNGGTGDGVIDRMDENLGQRPFITSGAECIWGPAPHEAGNYRLEMNFMNDFNGGAPLVRNLSLPAGLVIEEFPPVLNLNSTWNDTSNELNLTWDLPEYPETSLLDYMQIRILAYNNGQYLNNQVRVTNLPVTINRFTLDSDMTTPFNHIGVDQIMVQVRVYGANNTIASTNQGYNFDSQTGTLVPAQIGMNFFDIDGDGKTGLGETIHTLKVLTGE